MKVWRWVDGNWKKREGAKTPPQPNRRLIYAFLLAKHQYWTPGGGKRYFEDGGREKWAPSSIKCQYITKTSVFPNLPRLPKFEAPLVWIWGRTCPSHCSEALIEHVHWLAMPGTVVFMFQDFPNTFYYYEATVCLHLFHNYEPQKSAFTHNRAQV